MKKIDIKHHDDEPEEKLPVANEVPKEAKDKIAELAEEAEKKLGGKKIAVTEQPEQAEDVEAKESVSDDDDELQPSSEEDNADDVEDIEKSNEEHSTEPEAEQEVDPLADPEEEQIEIDEQGNPIGESEPEAEDEPDKDLGEDASLAEKVDDIVRTESDELLQSEDKELVQAFEPQQKRSLSARIKSLLKTYIHSARARWITIFSLLLIVALIAAIPAGRYFALNTLGVRSRASLTVVDYKTQQPLKNVTVTLAGKQVKTDSDGMAKFSQLRLGPTELKIEKRAFAPTQRKLTIGWGSNPLGDFKVTAIGTLFNFSIQDWLSNKPIEKAEAVSGDASAFSNHEGKLVLAVEKSNDEEIRIIVSYNGYRPETIVIDSDDKTEQTIKLVPARKHLFVSKRSGKLDTYKIDADGKNEKLLLAGTGVERDDMAVLPHQSGDVAALISTREGTRNKDGFLMSGLFIVDIESGQIQRIGRSERVQLVGWLGDRLVYVLVSEGVSGSNPKRHKLVSYHYKEGTSKELAYANYFNDVLAAGTRIYYAPSNAFMDNNVNAKLFSINADGTDRQTILDKEAWNVFRTGYANLSISDGKDWYAHSLGGGAASKQQNQPGQLKSRIYIDNFDRTQAVWIDERDGKGVLLEHTIKKNSDRILVQQIGLNYPLYWLSNSYVVYRMSGNNETADYVISTQGGEPRKIRDVTDTGGIDNWYFY